MTTREQLRNDLIDGIDRLQNSIAWRRFLSEEDRRRALAARIFWKRDIQRTNDTLDDIVDILNNMQPEMKETDVDPKKLGAIGIPQDVVDAAKKVGMDAEELAKLCVKHTVDAVRDFLSWAQSKLPGR